MKDLILLKFKNHIKAISALIILSLLVFFGYEYWHKANIPHSGAFKVSVVVQHAKLKDVPITLSYPARISGYKNIAVQSQVSGILQNILFNPGEMVEKGEDLFQIDQTLYAISLKDAEGKLQIAQANFWLTERAFERANILYKVEAVSSEDMDTVTANLKKARSMVMQSQADVVKAQTNLSYTLIKAPIRGLVSKETQSVGSLINAQSGSNLLTYIVQTDPIYINFSFPSAEFMDRQAMIKKGKLYIRSNDELEVGLKLNSSLYDFKGKLLFVDNFIDPETQTISARGEIDNPSNKLIPGSFVTVIIEGYHYKKVALIQDQALLQTNQGVFLYVVKDDKVTLKNVILGELIGKNRIILEGLDDGDQVIVEGMIKVKPSSEVIVSNVISN